MLIESISGIRGVFPSDFDTLLAEKYALAFHRFCEDGHIIIGRDTRPSGSKLVSSIIGTFESVGRDVRDCGICPTPTVQFIVGDTDAVGGIVVTASHNPKEWNGLKFFVEDGCFLNGQQFERLVRLVNGPQVETKKRTGGYSRFDQAVRRHIERIIGLKWIDADLIRSQQFRVAVDTVNGAASDALPQLLGRLKCDVVKINCDFTGEFARDAEPLPENLVMIGDAVRKHRCDVGFATDPDADRVAVVDEFGNPVGEEYTLVLAIDDFLRSSSTTETIVTNLSTTMAVDEVAQQYGAKVERSAVGEINVVELMKNVNASIGGEGNGGVILRDVHLGRDSLVGAALVLDRMAGADQPVSAIVSESPRYHMVKDNVSLTQVNPDQVFQAMTNAFADADQNLLDGLKLTWHDKWIHIRPSNTEPILRIYAEAKTKNEAQDLVQKVKGFC